MCIPTKNVSYPIKSSIQYFQYFFFLFFNDITGIDFTYTMTIPNNKCKYTVCASADLGFQNEGVGIDKQNLNTHNF